MGAYAPAGFCNKKAPKLFLEPWCKHFYALYTVSAGKPQQTAGAEYPDLVLRGVLPLALSAKPSPIFLE